MRTVATKFYFLFSCCCCFSFAGKCQEYSYKHYEIKDGLVGNNVYQVTEDKDGFLWFATETGVSRFDGTNFKNFTTAEGLPDNEVLKLFVDSKGRVWMLPFKNKLCYYYKGKIFNAGNDSTLARLQLKAYVKSMFEDDKHNLFFMETNGINVLQNNGKVLSKYQQGEKTFHTFGAGVDDKFNPLVFLNFENQRTNLYKIVYSRDSIELQQTADSIHFFGNTLSRSCITLQIMAYSDNYLNVLDYSRMIFNHYKLNKSDTINLPQEYNQMSFINDSILFFNTNFGALKYNYKTNHHINSFLENERISYTLKDKSNNLWFTTLGNGIFRIYSEENKNIYFTENKLNNSVESILVTDHQIVVGAANSTLYVIDKSNLKKIASHAIRSREGVKKVIKLVRHRNGVFVLGENSINNTDLAFRKVEEIPIKLSKTSWTIKDIDIKNDTFYLATHLKTFAYSPKNAGVKDIFEQRSTAVCIVDSGVYIGTQSGLLFMDRNNKLTSFSDRFPLLSNRITKLLFANNKLWIGTNDVGVICFNGATVEKNITINDGLAGNLVRALYATDNFLWVGTDRGLSKVSLSDTSYRVVRKYTISDGLASNMINAVFVQHDTVYVGTAKGLSFFNERNMDGNSSCVLRLLGITVSGTEISFDSSKLFLENKNNNIRFDFVAISYKSEGNILYYYKLSDIDSDWKTTRENFLQYPTLPSGNYTMLLYAINKFGIKSETIEIRFEIEKKLFEESWFIGLIIVLFIFIAWLLAKWQIRRVQKSQQAKTANAEKIAQLEQQALKAQMNPHFIFNCLNSIQQYVIDKDVHGANKFISGFSKLIRQTLDNSGKHSITVSEEENFLRSYLELEKSRFEDKFDYNISIDGRISKDEDRLPPMLLQPYIENCIRHGIMHKNDGTGVIDISFNLADGKLVCSVTDNGIGRDASNAFKGAQHINYQSKGTELTGQRIKMINKSNNTDIVLKIEDLTDSGNEPCGTKVTIVIPIEKTD